MTTTAPPPVRNGIDTAQVYGTLDALKDQPELARFEFRATNLSTLAQMVASGAGITLMPQLAVSVERRRAGIHLRHFSKPAPHRTIGLVWRKGSPLDGALRKIAEVLREAYPRSQTE